MLIIGEKINGTLKKVGPAVLDRDAAFIQDLARRQAEAGADYIDVNAGTPATREADDLVWLVETVQAVVDVPLCLDSANPRRWRPRWSGRPVRPSSTPSAARSPD